MITRFHFPTEIVFGEGAIQESAKECSVIGVSRPLLVTDQGIVGAGLADKVIKVFKSAGLLTKIFDQVSPNPTGAQVDEGARVYKEEGADCIVALGGGSPMDAAKGIRLRIEHLDPLETYDDLKGGDAKITGSLPPMIAIPTTAGTGSEVSRSAVITVEAVARKVVIFSPRLMPDVAICDPELTYGLPPRLTAETGMDAMSHSIEAFMAKGYNPMADSIALKGIFMISQNLVTAVQDGGNVEARRELMMASTMGATAFQKGLGAVHSLAHPLSTVCNVSHGLANSILLPHILRFNAEAVPKKAEELANALGLENSGGNDAAEFIEALAGKCGLPGKLSQAGVDEKSILELAAKAMEDGCHLSNPRPCSEDTMKSLLEAAM
ncbi:MAG: iron-containing alcohol dehydrogenase [Deltaproteobacteria bacterium]|nr:iron-containing alcohol dehydrogenase [Deltaproteobacteria bacterium]